MNSKKEGKSTNPSRKNGKKSESSASQINAKSSPNNVAGNRSAGTTSRDGPIVTAKSFERCLPKGYWGPNGKPSQTTSVSRRQSEPHATCGSSKKKTTEKIPRNPAVATQAGQIVRNRPMPSRLGKTKPTDSKRQPGAHLPVDSAKTETTERTTRIRDDAIQACQLGRRGSTTPGSKTRASKTTQAEPKRNDQRYGEKCYEDANKYLCKVFQEQVQLRQEDIQRNKTITSRLKVCLGEVTQLDPSFPLRTTEKSLSFTGSYFEKLKVSRPNEFDVMVSLDIKAAAVKLEYEREKDMEGYVKLKILQEIGNLAPFMTDDRKYLSPIKIRQRFLQLVEGVTLSDKNVQVIEHGPAVQLTFTDNHGRIVAEADLVLSIAFPDDWPQHAIVERRGLSSDILQRIKAKGFHVVPKTLGNETKSVNNGVHWRVSYSLAEKELILHNMKDKEKRDEKKKVIKFVKFLRERHEHDLPGMHSFHLKNVFLEQALITKRLSSWDRHHFMERIIDILSELLEACSNGQLRHFFNGRCNLFLNVSSQDRKKCTSTIENILDALRSNDTMKIDLII